MTASRKRAFTPVFDGLWGEGGRSSVCPSFETLVFAEAKTSPQDED
jgi:hypothetical protein